MTETHQPIAAIEHAAHVHAGITGALDFLDHSEYARRRPTVQRATHGTDSTGNSGGHVRARRCDDARSEGGGIHSVLGGGDEVRVDRPHVLGVGLASPTDHHALNDGVGAVDLNLRNHGNTDATC